MRQVEQRESARSSSARRAAARARAADQPARLGLPADVLRLQQLAGNQATARMLTPAAGPQLQRAIAFDVVREQANTDLNTKGPARKRWLGGKLVPEMQRIFGPLWTGNPGTTVDAWAVAQRRDGEPDRGKRAFHVKQLAEGFQYLDVDFRVPVTTAGIAAFNEQIHALEVAVDPSLAVPESIASTEFGSELTFVDQALEDIEGVRDKNEMHKAMRGPYNVIATAWRNAMTQLGIAPSNEQRADGMLYLTYTFTQATHGVDWNYRVTPDQQCVEIITSKAKGSDLFHGTVGDLIDEYVYAIARRCNLRAHATIGGGHINMDEKSAFGAYDDDIGAQRAGVVLAEFMKAYYADYQWWADRDPDAHNSPFPSELKTNAAFEKAMQDFEKARTSKKPWTLIDLVDHLFKHVFNTSSVSQNPIESRKYQALNVNALGEDTPEDERRIEVRRVPAPPNRATLLDQLRRVALLLAQARENARRD